MYNELKNSHIGEKAKGLITMKTITKSLNINLDISKYFKHIKNHEVLFFDIETTGFTADRSNLYLIGYIYNKNGTWIFSQFFAEKYSDEWEVLECFFELCKDFVYTVHFNGDTFDTPYILKKSLIHNLDSIKFKNLQSVDLYKIIKKYKNIFNLENLKQKSLEKFLGIHRTDKFTGGELIEQYKTYVKNPNPPLERNLLLHNEEDLYGMLDLLRIVDYTNFISSVKTLQGDSITNIRIKDLGFKILLTSPVPSPFDLTLNNGTWTIIFKASSNEILINIEILSDTLMHFFKDYKNYYYIAEKDEAIHKSVGKYVDTSKKVPANKENCYIKKSGDFIETFVTISDIQVFKKGTLSKSQYIHIKQNQINKELILKNVVKILDK